MCVFDQAAVDEPKVCTIITPAMPGECIPDTKYINRPKLCDKGCPVDLQQQGRLQDIDNWYITSPKKAYVSAPKTA